MHTTRIEPLRVCLNSPPHSLQRLSLHHSAIAVSRSVVFLLGNISGYKAFNTSCIHEQSNARPFQGAGHHPSCRQGRLIADEVYLYRSCSSIPLKISYITCGTIALPRALTLSARHFGKVMSTSPRESPSFPLQIGD